MQELRQKNSQELANLLLQKKKELVRLKVERTQGKIKDNSIFSRTRKDIARILTALVHHQ